MKIIKEFKEFALRGNVVDMTIGVVLGSAFTSIVHSFVNDIFMPPIGLLLSKVNFSNLFIDLSGKHFASLAEAKAAGVPTVNYGAFINTVISFLIVATALFFLIKMINRLRRAKEEPKTKTCKYCFSQIPIQAVRCPNCTSALRKEVGNENL